MEVTVTIPIREYDRLREAEKSIRKTKSVIFERNYMFRSCSYYYVAYTENEVILNQNELIKKLNNELEDLKKKEITKKIKNEYTVKPWWKLWKE